MALRGWRDGGFVRRRASFPRRLGLFYTSFARTIRAGCRTGAVLPCLAILAGCERSPTTPVDPADPTFSIDIRYWGLPPTTEQQERIEAAAARWERLISAGVPDAEVVGDIGCGVGSPELNATVDDIVVYVRVIDIVVLAESGPCKVRANGGLPITGTVWLDGPDRLGRLAPEFIESLVTHEIGHALGFGSLWNAKGLLGEPSLSGGTDPHFRGPRAQAEFDAAGGLAYTGKKVPVETFGGDGTADSHWRASVMGDAELMSFTIGYQVDLSAADDYALPASTLLAPDRTPMFSEAYPRLSESPPRWSITVTDARGAVVR